ncbi:class I SAM-dependent methyltransferase [Photobacterium sp. MCCC 1A19761]|uniref:class I SAM-dependent methyltransferase n=1 Tax=Photobacterium sp. MCCC 1A19761 TaxID=3115000 RepID=UPI00307D487B
MDYLDINQKAWDLRAKVHVESEFYDVAGFLKGKSSLNPIELAQVGEVKGKRLLHLQCHFGQDTLSWARLGAEVTGVDLSSEAIECARGLAEQIGVDARFIQDDLYRFGDKNQDQFDLVFTSYGALCWLPDLTRWARTVAAALKPGGQVHLVEFHPFLDLLSGYPYFPQPEPEVEEEGTYTENCTGETSTVLTWSHSLSEVIAALIQAGIVIEEVQEYPFSPYNCFPDLEYVAGQGYQKLFQGQQIPLVYGIKGRKAA